MDAACGFLSKEIEAIKCTFPLIIPASLDLQLFGARIHIQEIITSKEMGSTAASFDLDNIQGDIWLALESAKCLGY